jgi:hypothetical protein
MSLHRMVSELYGGLTDVRARKPVTGLRALVRRIYSLTSKTRLDDLRDLDETLQRMVDQLGPLSMHLRRMHDAQDTELARVLQNAWPTEWRNWRGTTQGLALFLLRRYQEETDGK